MVKLMFIFSYLLVNDGNESDNDDIAQHISGIEGLQENVEELVGGLSLLV